MPLQNENDETGKRGSSKKVAVKSRVIVTRNKSIEMQTANPVTIEKESDTDTNCDSTLLNKEAVTHVTCNTCNNNIEDGDINKAVNCQTCDFVAHGSTAVLRNSYCTLEKSKRRAGNQNGITHRECFAFHPFGNALITFSS